MASALPVDDTYEWHPEDQEDVSSTWADHLQTLKGAGYGVLSGLAGAVDLAASDPFEGDYTARARAGVLDWLSNKQKEAVEGMTPQGRRNAQAAILPKEGTGNDIFDPNVSARSKIAGTVIGAAPSIVASILGSLIGGPVLGYGVAGAMDAGSMWNDVREKLNNMPDAELQEKNDLYAGLRDMGLTEREARTHILNEAARNKALIVGTFTAATSRYGAEGIVARALGGKEARVGVARGVARGALGEAGEEGAQSAVSEFLTQKGQGEVEGERNKPTDWYDLANKVAESMIGGAGAGGIAGGAFRGGHKEPAQPRVAATPSPVGPSEATALAAPAAPQAGTAINDQNEQVLNAPPVPQAPPTPAAPVSTLNPEIEAALAPVARVAPSFDPTVGEEPADLDTTDIADQGPPAPPVVPILQPAMQEAIGAPPETALPSSGVAAPDEVRGPAAAVAPAVAEPAAAPVAPVEPAPVTTEPAAAPAPPTTGTRILEDVAAKKKERKGPRLTPAKQAQLVAGETELLPERAHQRRLKEREYAATADRVRAAIAEVPHPGATADVNVMRAYVKALTERAGVGAKTPLPRVGEDTDPALALIKSARSLTAGSRDALTTYLGTDRAFRGGAEEQALETRRAQAAKAEQSLKEDEAGSGPTTTVSAAVAERDRLENELLGTVDEQRAAKRRAELEAELARRKEIRNREAKARAEEAAREATAAAERWPARPVVVEKRRAAPPKNAWEAARKQREATEFAKREAEAKAQEEKANAEYRAIKDTTQEVARIMRERDAAMAKQTDFVDAVPVAQEYNERIAKARVALREIVGEVRTGRAIEEARKQSKTAATEKQATEQLQAIRTEEADLAPEPPVRENISQHAAGIMARRAQQQAAGKRMLRGPAGVVEVDKPVTFDEALAGVKIERLSRLQRNTVNFFQSQISPLIEGTTKVHLVSDAQYFALRGNRTSRAYHHKGAIVINRDVSDTDARFAHDIIHEGSHGALEDAIAADPIAERRIEMLRDEMRDYLTRVSPALANEYGFTDAHEFIAEIISNPTFQRMAAEIPASKQLKEDLGFSDRPASLWQTFVGLVRSIFKVDPNRVTLLDVALRHTENLFDAANRMKGADRGFPLTVRDMSVQGARERAGDQRRAMALGARGLGIRVAPFHYLTKQFDSLFTGNPMARVQKTMDLMRVYGDRLQEKGRVHAVEWAKLVQSNIKEATKASHAVIEITRANMNPIDGPATLADLLKANQHFGDIKSDKATNYQARANLVRLQKLFMGLEPSTRKQILAAAKYFKDTQNDRTRQAIRKILNVTNSQMLTNPEVLTGITERTARGKLTEDDRAAIGDDNLFKALQNAQELRLIEGMYFPLLRHGNFVVTTMDRVGDMHGGKLDGDDIIEFRAADDKAARAAFKAFAEDPANSHIRVETVAKRRYSLTGEIMTEPDSRGQTHDVAYRARIQRKGVYFFNSAREAEAFRREIEGSVDERSEVRPRMEFEKEDALTSTHVRAIERALDKRTDVNANHRALLKGLLREASVMQLTGNRIQQRALPRRGNRGASDDIARSIITYAQAASAASARMEYADTIRAAVDDMEKQTAARSFSAGQAAMEQVLTETKKRTRDGNVDPQAPPQWMQDMSALSYIYRLGDAAYSIMNGMQPWMLTLPRIAGEYGELRSMSAMARAYKDVAAHTLLKGGLLNTANATRNFKEVALNTRDLIQSVRERLKDDPALAAFDEAASRGKIDDGAGMEVKAISAGLTTGGNSLTEGGRKVLSKVDRIARQLPQAIEVINRAVTVVATYRLAKAAGSTHEDAIERAFDIMMMTQGDYSVQNAPRIFQHPLARPALQFKNFALMTGTLLYDMVSRSFGSAPLQQRQQAWRQIGGIIAVQMLAAGAFSLPGLEFLKVGMMAAAALGLSDGYDDWERKMRKLMDEAAGKTWGELLSSGILSRAINVDLSKRASMADMLTFGEPKDYSREGMQSYFASVVFGAPGSMVFDWLDGIKLAQQGEYLKALEKTVPIKLAVDFSKAVRGTMNRDITMGEAALQAVGFRSGRMAEEGRKVGDEIAAAKKFQEGRKDLTRQLLSARTEAERAAVRQKMKDQGASRPARKKLDDIIQERETKRRALQGG